MSFGRRLARARKDAGLSQKEAAGKLGMHQSALSMMENERGGREMRISELARAAELYGCSADWLLGLGSERVRLRRDLAIRLDRLPEPIVRVLFESPLYELYDFLESAGLLKVEDHKEKK